MTIINRIVALATASNKTPSVICGEILKGFKNVKGIFSYREFLSARRIAKRTRQSVSAWMALNRLASGYSVEVLPLP